MIRLKHHQYPICCHKIALEPSERRKHQRADSNVVVERKTACIWYNPAPAWQIPINLAASHLKPSNQPLKRITSQGFNHGPQFSRAGSTSAPLEHSIHCGQSTSTVVFCCRRYCNDDRRIQAHTQALTRLQPLSHIRASSFALHALPFPSRSLVLL